MSGLIDPGLALMIVAGALLAAGYALLSRRLSAKQVAVIATMAALAAAGRVAFAAVPSVQPATVIVVISGYVLGPAAGFLVGATTAFVSNFFLGHGPWTIWQMLSWGLVGTVSGAIARAMTRRKGSPRRDPGRRDTVVVLVLSVLSGFAFSWLMNLWFWVSFVYPHTWGSLLVTYAGSAWFDISHAAGNAVFAVLLAPKAMRVLRRFTARMHYERTVAVQPTAPAEGAQGVVARA